MAVTDCIRDVFMKVDVAGIKLIVNRNRHLTSTERIMFTTLFLVLVGISISFLLSAWISYQEHPTVRSFKGGKNTNCSSAALTICPTYGIMATFKIAAYCVSSWGLLSKKRSEYYKKFVKNIANSSIYNLPEFGRFVFDPTLPHIHLNHLQRRMNEWRVRYSPDLETMFGEPKLIISEGGNCISYGFIEEDQSYNTRKIMPCFLQTRGSFRSKPGDKFYIHSPYDLPDFEKPTVVPLFAANHIFEIKIIEERADPAIRKVSIQQRKCRFPDENFLTVISHYTNAWCRMQCRMDMVLKLCNCFPHFYRTTTVPHYCTPEGLACVSRYQKQLLAAINDRQACNCDATCGEVTFESRELLHKDQVFLSSVYNGISLYTAFYDRSAEMVVKHHLVYSSVDMLASWGGAVSLFLGVSLLTFIELTYLAIRWPITQWRSSRNTTVKLSKEHRILSWWRKKSLKENCFFKCINSFSRGITNSFKEWLDKTSFNVISYVGNMEILIIERVFWFALFAAAIYGSCKSAWQMIKDNEPIIDELHVSQVEIPYKFPTFTICGQIPYPGLYKKDIAQFRKGWCLFPLMFISSRKFDLTSRISADDCFEERVTITVISKDMYKYSMDLQRFVTSMKLEDHNLTDWRVFQPIQTERGPCFTLNSEQAPPILKHLKAEFQKIFRKKREVTSLELRMNLTLGPHSLLKRFTAKYFSIHSGIDILTGTDELSGVESTIYDSVSRIYRPQEIEPDPDISEWPPEIRGCRHPDEVLANQFYPKYSYSACIASCRAQEMMQKCGCVHPMSAISGGWPLCDLEQYYCIEENIKTIYLPAEWKNLNCGCVRSCSDTSYYGVFQNEKSDQKGIVSIKVIPGHEKIRLRLKTGKLDVFVMVGGMFGLFVGASMMSIVEVIMFFTIRFLTNIIRQFHN